MTSHRGRGHIPVRRAAVSIAAAIAVGAGSYTYLHDPAPVRVIPVGSVVPLPSPSVSPAPSVDPVQVCIYLLGGGMNCQDARRVVDGSAVTR
ncbi:hypothetical protein MXD62_23015 [Frankia sp. Mgl5]|uniref:hypothetical protein n=1 Tax=Frankia sp. Mgl5 TaxID=2933793 RepID=UPI002010537A|nr:hypothetical protein [Frankia sp. Mgl5]MCK9930001.1 hypothetical protein [Frankia sp. Mgl5]